MAKGRTAGGKASAEPSAGRTNHTQIEVVCTIAIATATLTAFLPLLANQFVNWDDPYALTNNRQLASSGILGWAFTTRLMGHVQPLAWLAWSAVDSIAGMSPAAFHVLSLVGHVVNVTLVYVVTRRLMLKTPVAHDTVPVAATATALLFAVHPLRVEPVAWASAFPYVLSLTWLLVATLFYLRSTDSGDKKVQWLGVSVVSYVMSLLSRVAALGYPLVLVILDVFPLRRVEPVGANDLVRNPSRVTWAVALLEKVPFVVAAIVLALLEAGSRVAAPLEEIGVGARLTAAAQAPIVYLTRMMAPLPRSPIDPLPISPVFEPTALALALTGLAVLIGAAWRLRRSWPAVTAAWLTYLVLLAPVMGLTPSGQTETADRYMYVPGVALSIILGLAIARIPPRFGGWRTSVALIAGATLLLGTLTWRGIHWWHDSTTLWTRALEFDPRDDIATYNLAVAFQADGRRDEAIARYQQTLALIPDHAPARQALVDLRADRGIAFAKESQFAAAAADLRFALDARPDDIGLAQMLSFALTQIKRDRDAMAVLKEAIARHPENDQLAHNLARLLATSEDTGVRNGALALRLALAVRERTGGRDPRILDTLAAAYAATGQGEAARRAAIAAETLARQLGESALAAEIAAHPWSAPTTTNDAKR